MIKVYHANNPTFTLGPITKPVDKSDYSLVASVDTSNLDSAFELTNTIDSGWWENEEVTFHGSPIHGKLGCRSSSVGDIFEYTGQFFVIAPAGFEPIEMA